MELGPHQTVMSDRDVINRRMLKRVEDIRTLKSNRDANEGSILPFEGAMTEFFSHLPFFPILSLDEDEVESFVARRYDAVCSFDLPAWITTEVGERVDSSSGSRIGKKEEGKATSTRLTIGLWWL